MPKLPAPRASAHTVELERLRRTIPTATLLKLAELAATTGQMPILDLNGAPTGEYSKLDTNQRLSQINRLIDKAMPDRVEPPMLPEDNKLAVVTDVRNLSDEDLEALANEASARPVLPEPTEPPASAVPGHSEALGAEPGSPGTGGASEACSDPGTAPA